MGDSGWCWLCDQMIHGGDGAEEDYFERNEVKPAEFAKKRKQHYDEFKQVAKMRELMRNKPLSDEDDDDDDGEREEHGDDTHQH